MFKPCLEVAVVKYLIALCVIFILAENSHCSVGLCCCISQFPRMGRDFLANPGHYSLFSVVRTRNGLFQRNYAWFLVGCEWFGLMQLPLLSHYCYIVVFGSYSSKIFLRLQYPGLMYVSSIFFYLQVSPIVGLAN